MNGSIYIRWFKSEVVFIIFDNHTWWPSIGVITAGSGNEGKPDEDPPPVNGDSDPSVVKLWGEISPYPDMADGVSPPPNGPNGGLLLNVVRDWDGVAFGESEQEW